jgi:hypothetical protein
MSNAAIPGPAGHWLIGNVGDINVDNTTESMCRLTRTHGECSLLLREVGF